MIDECQKAKTFIPRQNENEGIPTRRKQFDALASSFSLTEKLTVRAFTE